MVVPSPPNTLMSIDLSKYVIQYTVAAVYTYIINFFFIIEMSWYCYLNHWLSSLVLRN